MINHEYKPTMTEAVDHFIEMCREHDDTKSCRVAKRLICACVSRNVEFYPRDMVRFDSNNCARALAILSAVGDVNYSVENYVLSNYPEDWQKFCRDVAAEDKGQRYYR